MVAEGAFHPALGGIDEAFQDEFRLGGNTHINGLALDDFEGLFP